MFLGRYFLDEIDISIYRLGGKQITLHNVNGLHPISVRS